MGLLCKEQAATVLGVAAAAEALLGRANACGRLWRRQRPTLAWLRARVAAPLATAAALLALRLAVMRGQVAEFDWQTNPAAKAPQPVRVARAQRLTHSLTHTRVDTHTITHTHIATARRAR